MNRSYKFAVKIADSLRDGDVEPIKGLYFKVTGRLKAGSVIVPIEVFVPWLFRDVKRDPPIVYCREHWMKTGADWHNGPSMCWVLPNQWRDRMSWRGKPVQSIMEEGCEWLLNNSICLINRHYYAHLNGITEWLDEWAYWDHFGEGIREYERGQRQTR